MSWVRLTAIRAMARVLLTTAPPSPMFSPHAVQWTPAAVSRVPRSGSPEHWCDRAQPPAIVELCADALASRPAVMVSAGRPAAERAWLMSARTWAAALPEEVPAGFVAGAAGAGDAGDAGLADACADAVGDDRGWRRPVLAADGPG